MTALDRARAWFLEPASPASEAGHADSPAVEADLVARHAAADPFAAPEVRATARQQIGSAVVLGRPGQAEPVAAAVALALGQGARSRAATVAVIAAEEPDVSASGASAPNSLAAAENFPDVGGDDRERPAGGGTRAARRLAARLDAHGLPARPRGRLVWVRVPGEHRQAAARRAMLVGTPAVLAVTAPRTPDIEELLAEQELLLLVMADPAGPLARIASLAPGGIPVAVTRPLPRGSRSLAMAGLRAPRPVCELLASATASGASVRAAA